MAALLAVPILRHEPKHHDATRAQAITATQVATTEPGVQVDDLAIGTCLLWSGSFQNVATRRIVDCSQPHYAELVGRTTVVYGHYPTRTQRWALEAEYCNPQAKRYLGYTFPKSSRFQVSSFFPTPTSWAQGVRTIYCSLQHIQVTLDEYRTGGFHAFRGRVYQQDQELLRPTGTCLVYVRSAYRDLETPCNDTHDMQITGRVDVSRLARPPTDWVAAAERAYTACRAVGTRFGRTHPVPAHAFFASIPVDQSLWDEGDRIAQCDWRASPVDPSTTRSAPPTTT